MRALPTPTASHAAEHDQYFTRPEVAQYCIQELVLAVPEVDQSGTWWVEPSAGAGAFLEVLESQNRAVWAGDIHPQHRKVAEHNYLTHPLPAPPLGSDRVAVVGNPPFGRKADLAVDFINRGLEHGGLVAFIVPIQLRKWSAQKRVQADAKLLVDIRLKDDAFLFLGKPYRLRSCFQVWTTWPAGRMKKKKATDLRLTHAPHTRHADFDAWQYNCTPEALKYFDYDWDFAVLRQGFGDFTEQFEPQQREALDRRKQWVFIKAHSPDALARLRALDFVALSHQNTGTPGFGKADLVAAYEQALLDEQTPGRQGRGQA